MNALAGGEQFFDQRRSLLLRPLLGGSRSQLDCRWLLFCSKVSKQYSGPKCDASTCQPEISGVKGAVRGFSEQKSAELWCTHTCVVCLSCCWQNIAACSSNKTRLCLWTHGDLNADAAKKSCCYKVNKFCPLLRSLCRKAVVVHSFAFTVQDCKFYYTIGTLDDKEVRATLGFHQDLATRKRRGSGI